MDLSTGKKISIVALIGYAAFWVYNNVYKATDRLLFGAIGWGGIEGGSIILTFPISNVGQLPLKMTGLTGTMTVLDKYTVGSVAVRDAVTFAPNTTQTLRIAVSPNWVTLASVAATTGRVINQSNYAEILAQLQPKLKATLFTPAFTQPFEQQIA